MNGITTAFVAGMHGTSLESDKLLVQSTLSIDPRRAEAQVSVGVGIVPTIWPGISSARPPLSTEQSSTMSQSVSTGLSSEFAIPLSNGTTLGANSTITSSLPQKTVDGTGGGTYDLPDGILFGIILGPVIGVAVISTLAFLLGVRLARRRRNRQNPNTDSQSELEKKEYKSELDGTTMPSTEPAPTRCGAELDGKPLVLEVMDERTAEVRYELPGGNVRAARDKIIKSWAGS